MWSHPGLVEFVVTPTLTVHCFTRDGREAGPGPLFILREWDLKVIRSIGHKPKCKGPNTEQALRACVRQGLLSMSLKTENAAKDEVQSLKHVGVLGKRAPSGSLIGAADLVRLLEYFSKSDIVEAFKAALKAKRDAGEISDAVLREVMKVKDNDKTHKFKVNTEDTNTNSIHTTNTTGTQQDPQQQQVNPAQQRLQPVDGNDSVKKKKRNTTSSNGSGGGRKTSRKRKESGEHDSSSNKRRRRRPSSSSQSGVSSHSLSDHSSASSYDSDRSSGSSDNDDDDDYHRSGYHDRRERRSRSHRSRRHSRKSDSHVSDPSYHPQHQQHLLMQQQQAMDMPAGMYIPAVPVLTNQIMMPTLNPAVSPPGYAYSVQQGYPPQNGGGMQMHPSMATARMRQSSSGNSLTMSSPGHSSPNRYVNHFTYANIPGQQSQSPGSAVYSPTYHGSASAPPRSVTVNTAQYYQPNSAAFASLPPHVQQSILQATHSNNPSLDLSQQGLDTLLTALSYKKELGDPSNNPQHQQQQAQQHYQQHPHPDNVSPSHRASQMQNQSSPTSRSPVVATVPNQGGKYMVNTNTAVAYPLGMTASSNSPPSSIKKEYLGGGQTNPSMAGAAVMQHQQVVLSPVSSSVIPGTNTPTGVHTIHRPQPRLSPVNSFNNLSSLVSSSNYQPTGTGMSRNLSSNSLNSNGGGGSSNGLMSMGNMVGMGLPSRDSVLSLSSLGGNMHFSGMHTSISMTSLNDVAVSDDDDELGGDAGIVNGIYAFDDDIEGQGLSSASQLERSAETINNINAHARHTNVTAAVVIHPPSNTDNISSIPGSALTGLPVANKHPAERNSLDATSNRNATVSAQQLSVPNDQNNPTTSNAAFYRFSAVQTSSSLPRIPSNLSAFVGGAHAESPIPRIPSLSSLDGHFLTSPPTSRPSSPQQQQPPQPAPKQPQQQQQQPQQSQNIQPPAQADTQAPQIVQSEDQPVQQSTPPAVESVTPEMISATNSSNSPIDAFPSPSPPLSNPTLTEGMSAVPSFFSRKENDKETDKAHYAQTASETPTERPAQNIE